MNAAQKAEYIFSSEIIAFFIYHLFIKLKKYISQPHQLSGKLDILIYVIYPWSLQQKPRGFRQLCLIINIDIILY